MWHVFITVLKSLQKNFLVLGVGSAFLSVVKFSFLCVFVDISHLRSLL
jgi:hypothetical protein